MAGSLFHKHAAVHLVRNKGRWRAQNKPGSAMLPSASYEEMHSGLCFFQQREAVVQMWANSCDPSTAKLTTGERQT